MYEFCSEIQDRKKRLNKEIIEAMDRKVPFPCAIYQPDPPPSPPQPAILPHDPIVPKPLPPPDLMVCYKVATKQVKASKTSKNKNKPQRTKRAKSRELRASILHNGCDCEKRNGLQDQCRRTGCHGSPECLVKPDPICGPSEFSNGKHLGKNKYGDGDGDDAEDESNGNGNGKPTVQYKCFPAIITPSK